MVLFQSLRVIQCSLISIVLLLSGCESKELKNAQQFIENSHCDQALLLMDQFVRNNPDHAKAFVLLGDAQFCLAKKSGNKGQLFAAIAAFESALKVDPGYTIAALHLGITNLLHSGNKKVALQAFSRGLKVRPDDLALRAYRSIVLWHNSEIEHAVEETAGLVESLNLDHGWYQQLEMYTGYTNLSACSIFEGCHDYSSGQLGYKVFDESGKVVGKIGDGKVRWVKCGQQILDGLKFICRVQYALLKEVKESLDQARNEVLPRIMGKLDPKLVDRLFNGEIRAGLPYVLVRAALGDIPPPPRFEHCIMTPSVVRDTIATSGLELTYENGFLVSWKGERISNVEDR